MLIVALIGAFILYVVLYFFVESAKMQWNSATPSAVVELQKLLFMVPQQIPLAILKWGIIIFAFYLVGDALVASTKRRRRNLK